MSGIARALVLSRPGPLRDSLTTLLGAIPKVQMVHQADDAASALKLIEMHSPRLVVLDAGLPNGEGWTALHQIRTRWASIPCVVFTDSVEYRHRAEEAGATQALMTGYPAAKLSTVLERLVR